MWKLTSIFSIAFFSSAASSPSHISCVDRMNNKIKPLLYDLAIKKMAVIDIIKSSYSSVLSEGFLESPHNIANDGVPEIKFINGSVDFEITQASKSDEPCRDYIRRFSPDNQQQCKRRMFDLFNFYYSEIDDIMDSMDDHLNKIRIDYGDDDAEADYDAIAEERLAECSRKIKLAEKIVDVTETLIENVKQRILAELRYYLKTLSFCLMSRDGHRRRNSEKWREACWTLYKSAK